MDQQENNEVKKIVIIGGGPAGLTGAFELLNRGACQVTLLEATDEIGGISRTARYRGNRMDIGGHRFFSKDDRVMEWWTRQFPVQGQPAWDDKRLGRVLELAPGGPDPEKEDRVMLLRRRVSRIYYLRRFFDYPISLKWDTLKNLGLGRTFLAGFSYLWSTAVHKPETSLENFYINRFGRILYSMFFENYTEKVWGLHPSKISAAWGAQRVKGLSVLAILRDMLRKTFGKKKVALAGGQKEVETSLIEQFFYPKFGPGQLWERVADEISGLGGTILRNARVTGLQAEPGRIARVTWKDEAGEEHQLEADYVLSSMPLRDLVGGLAGVEVPADVGEIASGLPYRDFMTVGLLVDRLAIENRTKMATINNLVPDCWIYVQEPGVRLGRLQIFNNWSPYLVADPQNTVWLGLEYFCQEGDAYWTMKDDDFCAMAAAELEKIGLIKANDVRDFCRIRVPKAYPAYFGTYDQIGRLTSYLDQFTNLYCIGRNGQHRYNNMDHSMLTAMKAVDQIIGGYIDKAAVWQVNAEHEYHEKKAGQAEN